MKAAGIVVILFGLVSLILLAVSCGTMHWVKYGIQLYRPSSHGDYSRYGEAETGLWRRCFPFQQYNTLTKEYYIYTECGTIGCKLSNPCFMFPLIFPHSHKHESRN